ncbi:fumarylacetoacetate hydrolase family protein [Dongshaea marina]|uniref:fumarylacetoacetate hydrolase family protein n=1 Tax=Dongshaea marina TaxID=2047966 RepID=UPI00131EEA87|nr:fumarylacetoacetate hydrolase family protein [Dongshaea marina]
MKLFRYGPKGQEKMGCVAPDGAHYDLSGIIRDHNICNLQRQLPELLGMDLATLPAIHDWQSLRIAPSTMDPGKFICVGANSRSHNKEMGITIDEPIFFFKPQSALSGAFDPIPYTQMNQQLDWEGELAIVIGKEGKNIPHKQAMEHLFGYCCFNDLSDRYWQYKNGGVEVGGQTSIAKCFDGFAPIGPYLVTADEIENPGNLKMELRVNGEVRQSLNTSDYLFGVAECISLLSQFMTLNPGDMIAVGSGPGNAKSWGDKYLKPGDEVSFEIEGLGRQNQIVKEVSQVSL